MKKHLLLILIALLTSLGASAYNFVLDGIYYNKLSYNKVEVTSGNAKYSGSVSIPSSITDENGNTYSVTKIGDYAFKECSGLTEVTIGNSVTSIGKYAFYNCLGLTSITIPNSVTSIGNYAFYNCSGLTSVTIGNSVTSIDIGAFSCSGLTSIIIPESITSIKPDTFSGCRKLTSVTIPNSVSSIGGSAFSYCTNLTSVTIPNSVTSFGTLPFKGCSGLKAFYGKYASEDNRSLIIGGVLIAFAPAGLTDYIIPNSVTSIGDDAFYNCSGLTSITIPNSVTSIGEEAFSHCSGLKSITIPNSVTSIGGRAFSYCTNLTSVTIPESVTSIDDSAFYECSGLTEITIPNSVTSIGKSAFSYCSGLTSVTIGNSVTSIGNYAFFGCSGLTSITIPNSVTSIGIFAFKVCSGLTSVTIGNSVTSIGKEAFYKCSGLTSITCLVENPSQISMDDDVFKNVPTSTCTLYVPKGSKSMYVVRSQWKDFANIVEIENTEIEEPNVSNGYELGIEDMVISPRKATNVPVYLKNEDEVTSMQFDIHLPAELTLAKDDYGEYAIGMTSRFNGTFSLSSRDIANGIRVLIFSNKNHSIEGNEGAIVELPVVLADQSVLTGTTFNVLIDNISVTMASDKSEKLVEDAIATLTLGKRYTPGDVNDDGRYSAADVSMIVSYVLESEPAGGIREAADINEDGRISAADVSIMVSYILEDRKINAPRRTQALDADAPAAERSEISVNADGNLTLSITGISAYTGAQFDIALPEGVAVKGVRLRGSDGTGHSVAFSQANGTARVLAFSPLNRNFGIDATFEIELQGGQASCLHNQQGNISSQAGSLPSLSVDGIRLVEIAGNDITEAPATGCTADCDLSGLLAGINRGMDIKATADGLTITAPNECDITIADTLGRTLRHHLHPGTNHITLSNGVYFINNKKVIIK